MNSGCCETPWSVRQASWPSMRMTYSSSVHSSAKTWYLFHQSSSWSARNRLASSIQSPSFTIPSGVG